MDNRLLWSRCHGGSLTVHRSDFGDTFGLGGYEWSTYHSELGGLVWVFEGVMTAHLGDRRWVLTPQHAAWLPAGCRSDVVANVPSRAMYVQWSAIPPAGRATRVRVGPETAALLHAFAGAADSATAGRLWRRIAAGLVPVHDGGLHLPLPRDPRGRRLAFGLMDQAADRFAGPHTLTDWADELFISAKTLQRIFLRDVGMTFPQWRTQVRLGASLPRLATGMPVQDVAREVGYQSSVGYIDAFQAHFRTTPGRFFRDNR